MIKDARELEKIANAIRQSTIRSLVHAGSGHSAGPLGFADVLTALYFYALRHDPKKPWAEPRDRFILSHGHICPVWYATLAHAGYFPIEELKTLRHLGTRLQGHPHIRAVPGVENTAGPLGQGISIAAGIALAAKMDKRDIRVFCGMGDGELEEGQCWEAFMFAAAKKLDNLIVLEDRNYIQIDGDTRDVMPSLDPLDAKMEAYNWHVITVDGNDMLKIMAAFDEALRLKGKPVMIIFNTTPGQGVKFIENDYRWHGKPPTRQQAEIALKQLFQEEATLEGKHCNHCECTLEACVCRESE